MALVMNTKLANTVITKLQYPKKYNFPSFCKGASLQCFYLHLTIYCVGVETTANPNDKNEHTKAASQ